MKGVDGKTRYSLLNPSIIPDREIFRLIAEKLGEKNPEVTRQAVADLEEISKHSRIDDRRIISQIVKRLQTPKPEPELFAVLRRQSQFLNSERLRRLYRSCIPTAQRVAQDQRQAPEARENVLLFLEALRYEELPDLAFKIISRPDFEKHRKTTFGIRIERICVDSARQERWRRSVYGLLLHEDKRISGYAKRILEQSRRPSFIQTP
jgi:hypothetical protein